jgi:hypothetical protein
LEAKIEELDDEKLIRSLKKEMEEYKTQAMTDLTAWDRVLLARHQKRPTAKDFIDHMIDDFVELRGDRLFGDTTASSAVSVVWTTSRSPSSPNKRAPTSKKTSTATSPCPIRKDIARRCVSCVRRRSSTVRS